MRLFYKNGLASFHLSVCNPESEIRENIWFIIDTGFTGADLQINGVLQKEFHIPLGKLKDDMISANDESVSYFRTKLVVNHNSNFVVAEVNVVEEGKLLISLQLLQKLGFKKLTFNLHEEEKKRSAFLE